MKKPFLFGAAAAIVAGAAFAASDRADAGGRQLVNLTYGSLRPVFASFQPGEKGSTSYVLDYKLANAIDKAVKPGVQFVLRTETKKDYGDHYDAAAFRAAAKALGLKAAPASTATLRGTELAAGGTAEGLAHFGNFDPNSDSFQVRVYGLWDPVFRDKQGRTWSERRVLVLSYRRAGDEYDRQLDEIRLESSKEELEGELVRIHEPK